jgi:sugar phosphate permease
MSPAHYRWIIFALMGAAYFVVYIQRMGLAVIATDLMEQVSLSSAQMGLLGSAFLYGYAVIQMISGMLAAKFGPRRLVTVFFLLAAAGVMLFASMNGFSQAFLGRMLSGIGVAVVLTSAITLFSRWFSTQEYPKVMAAYFALGGMGSLMATTPLSIMNTSFGWRDTFWFISVITCVIAVALWLAVRDYPPHAESGNNAPTQPQSINILDALKTLFTKRNFWCLVVWHGTMSACFYAFAGLWGGVYLEEV